MIYLLCQIELGKFAVGHTFCIFIISMNYNESEATKTTQNPTYKKDLLHDIRRYAREYGEYIRALQCLIDCVRAGLDELNHSARLFIDQLADRFFVSG